MSEPTEALEQIATKLLNVQRIAKITRAEALQAIRDAYDLGTINGAPKPADVARGSFGQTKDRTAAPGFVVRAVHTIKPEAIAEHGPETALMAWILQTVRELSDGGANPLDAMTIETVLMPDGAVVVTGDGVL